MNSARSREVVMAPSFLGSSQRINNELGFCSTKIDSFEAEKIRLGSRKYFTFAGWVLVIRIFSLRRLCQLAYVVGDV